MAFIDVKQFNKDTKFEVQNIRHKGVDVGNNWPVVYILNNDKEAYVGETVNAARRMDQHWQNEDRRVLTEVRIISDETFNKSTILDLESFLIKYMSADGIFSLQNGNNGVQDHQYFHKNEYHALFEEIWHKLIKCGIAKQEILEIENSELFKYSPYKALGAEQQESEREILKALSNYGDKEHGVNIIVRGGAGTGKTILAIYLIKLLVDLNATFKEDSTEVEELQEEYLDKFGSSIVYAENLNDIKKIGIVIPQSSLKTSVKEVFKTVKGLSPVMVLSPSDVVKDYMRTGVPFDLLLVDESHRLKCRYQGHLSNYRPFDECNEALGLDKMQGTELDWIMLCSRNQILFRDELQTVRPCDIPGKDFLDIVKKYKKTEFGTALSTQWRCSGGNDYIDYLKNILSGKQNQFNAIQNYEFKLYTNCDKMIQDIKDRNEKYGLCRVAAGYAWKWQSKPNYKDYKPYDIEIQGKQYRWNTTLENWITNPKSINEVGCIHTLQGYDLNYAGIIIGEDLKYNSEKHELYADKDCYFDQQGKSGVANKPKELLEYITNIYLTLLTRGVRGTYVYVCNDALREYLSQFIEVIE